MLITIEISLNAAILELAECSLKVLHSIWMIDPSGFAEAYISFLVVIWPETRGKVPGKAKKKSRTQGLKTY
jgi:hypothetical protein